MDGSTDKADEIFRRRQVAEAFLVRDANFVKTSQHPSWQGKIKCLYCKATGYPGNVQQNPYWWGKNHGYDCKWKELWLHKNRQPTVNITYSNNTNWNHNWYVGSNGTAFFRGRI